MSFVVNLHTERERERILELIPKPTRCLTRISHLPIPPQTKRPSARL